MDIKEKIKEEKNALFNRREVMVTIEAVSTPSKNEVRMLIAKEFKAKEECTRILKIASKFGSRVFEVSAHIYEKEADLKKFEHFSKKELEKIKKAQEEAKKAEEEAKAAKEEAAKPKEEEPAQEVSAEEKQDSENANKEESDATPQ